MWNTYYFVCLPFLLILTEHARCQSNYSYNYGAGGWLKVHTEPETWEEALLKCQRNGAVLASPLNQGLSDALQQQMTQFGVNGSIFLGTHDLYSKGYYVSGEGVPLSDMNVKWGAQGNETGTGDCLTMSADGRVHYSSCTDPLPFICYKKPNECDTYDDEYHLNKQTGSCYKVHTNKQTWTHAYRTCESEGAYLVILNDAEEARIVKNMVPPHNQQSREEFAIGLVSWGKDRRTWFTIHGEKIENVYNEWAAGEPNNANYPNEIRGACARVTGKLNDIPNDMFPMQFVCEKSPPETVWILTKITN